MRTKLLAAAVFLLAAVLTGCTSSEADLLQYASSTDAVVITGSMKDVIENAGCDVSGSTIRLTDNLKKMIDIKEDKVDLGLDPDHCLITANITADYTLIAFGLTSQSKFERVLKADNRVWRTRTERSGMVIYQVDPGRHIITTDGMMFYVSSLRDRSAKPDELLAKAKEQASKAPLASWQKDLLESGHTADVLLNIEQISSLMPKSGPLTIGYDTEAIKTGYVYLRAGLKDLKFDLVSQVYSHDGDVLTNSLIDKKADTDMLRYASDGALAVGMIALSDNIDWNKTFGAAASNPALRSAGLPFNSAITGAAAGVLSDITGTVMLSVEPGNMMEYDRLSGWGVTLAAQMAPGAAAKYTGMLGELMATQDVACTTSEGGFTATIPQQGTLTVAADGDTFVATTLPPDTPRGKGKYITADDFPSAYGGLAVKIPKTFPLLSLTGFNAGIEIRYSTTPDQVKVEASLTDTEGRLIENIINFAQR